MQWDPNTQTPNPITTSADSIIQLLNKVYPATIVSNGRRQGNLYVMVHCSALEPQLARLHKAGIHSLVVTLKVEDHVMVAPARVVKKNRNFFIYPINEAQKHLRELYERRRQPGRKRNPVTVLILDVRPEV
jgi:hypothetical protein